MPCPLSLPFPFLVAVFCIIVPGMDPGAVLADAARSVSSNAAKSARFDTQRQSSGLPLVKPKNTLPLCSVEFKLDDYTISGI
jgi:hypothetical protein